jgi:phosphoglycolate phosphatase-like HAD superfamily hydrolase
MVGAVIFEMDALLDLSALSEERRRARWREMRERLERAAVYPEPKGSMAVLELSGWVHELGAKVGIVTDLPRPVAIDLAERFGTSCNKLIDASHGFPPGPDPAAVEAMGELLGVAPSATLLVGSSKPLLAAAANARVLSAGVAWAGTGLEGWHGFQPDLGLRSPDDVAAALEAGATMRPLAEVLAEDGTPTPHWGSLIRFGEGVLAAGRHFSSTDLRLATHMLSGLILGAKSDRTAAGRLGEILGEAAALAQLPEADLVVSVPGRADAEFDRFEVARAAVAKSLGAKDGGGVLTMVKERPDYKDLDRNQRRMANQGRFQATRALDGEAVVLIDDVITSGSQARACQRELLGAGAGEVRTLVAAASQDPLQRRCPDCGEGVMRRFFGRRGPLYVCTKYGCQHTERWDG